jgi:sugar O-acyltransferase (sialic acid O-acetyltransferase NeuD family)
MTNSIIIGYSGHAYVIVESLINLNMQIFGYMDREKKNENPYNLQYLGSERTENSLDLLGTRDYFIAIGNNIVRKEINIFFRSKNIHSPMSIVDPSAITSQTSIIGAGCYVSAGAVINGRAEVGDGSICNTACIIEHECRIGTFVHIAPGAVLAGNVEVGDQSFIGANAVVKEGIRIGRNVIVGAGTVVLNDVPDHVTLVGNPAQIIKKN